MKLLALETATLAGSCALSIDGRIVFRDCPPDIPHAETLLPLATGMLHAEGLDFPQLDAIAFDRGPGAFTGLRIGAGVAQGLAIGLQLPVISVGSLEAIAWAAFCEHGATKTLGLLDARMGQAYVAAFSANSAGITPLSAASAADPADVPLPEGEGWHAAGNGLAAYPGLAARLAGLPCHPEAMPHARFVAQLAGFALACGQSCDPAEALPAYVRNKVAQTTAERLAAGLSA
jgi:tRNA threonylcarbamoyladenosine biosynthesis protein TsaB